MMLPGIPIIEYPMTDPGVLYDAALSCNSCDARFGDAEELDSHVANTPGHWYGEGVPVADHAIEHRAAVDALLDRRTRILAKLSDLLAESPEDISDALNTT